MNDGDYAYGEILGHKRPRCCRLGFQNLNGIPNMNDHPKNQAIAS